MFKIYAKLHKDFHLDGTVVNTKGIKPRVKNDGRTQAGIIKYHAVPGIQQ